MCRQISALAIALAISASINRSAQADWVECGSVEPFHIQSNYVLRDPRAVLRIVAQLKSEFEETLRLQPNDRIIEVCLFRTKRDYRQYVGKRVPLGEKHPALFVKGPDVSWVYIYDQPEFTQNLRHECTHALLHNSLMYLPLWLDEGLAEYLEVSPSSAGTQHPHLSRLRRRLALGWRPNLKKLESKSSHKKFTSDDYLEAWAWVHFLIHGPAEGRSLLSGYLGRIESREFVGRMTAHMNATNTSFDQQFVSHFRKTRRTVLPLSWFR